MSKMSFEKTKIGSFFARKGFYLALALCLVAVGASGWFAMDSLLPTGPESADGGSAVFEQDSPNGSDGLVNAGNPVSGVPAASRPAASEPTEQEPTGSADSSPAESAPSSSAAGDAEELPAGTQPDVPVQATFFVLPIGGGITKQYDDAAVQYSETCRDWRLHTGIDVAGTTGDRVNASGSGTVSEVYTDPLWGETVVVDHGAGICSYYCGLQNVKVKQGDTVEANQSIGQLGTVPCECVEQVHLHFAMKRDGKWISPLKLLALSPEESE